jgi:hypothetical protein
MPSGDMNYYRRPQVALSQRPRDAPARPISGARPFLNGLSGDHDLTTALAQENDLVPRAAAGATVSLV